MLKDCASINMAERENLYYMEGHEPVAQEDVLSSFLDDGAVESVTIDADEIPVS